MIPEKSVNLLKVAKSLDELWSPVIVGSLNGQEVKVAHVRGEFVSHHHEDQDEFFMVLKGHLDLALDERIVGLDEGDCFIVPRGVEHKPVAHEDTFLLLFEPAGTLNTGNVQNEFTHTNPERLF